MEEIGTSLNQTMAEIFETQSPLAKKRNKLQKQIDEAKEFIKENNLKSIDEKLDFTIIVNYLKIFYTGSSLERQITILEKSKHNPLYLITRVYGILTHRMDELQKIKDEIQNITES